MDKLLEYLPFLIPLALIQLSLMAAALVHILKHENYRVGSRVLWIILSIGLNIVGAVLYFTIGKSDETAEK